jgi:hypothetical protein
MFYDYNKPGERKGRTAFKKASYLRLVKHKEIPYIVGSGVYALREDRDFVMNLVDQFATWLAKEPRAALDAVKSHPLIYRDAGVFVLKRDGTQVIWPETEAGRVIVATTRITTTPSAEPEPIERTMASLATAGGIWKSYPCERPDGRAGNKENYLKLVQTQDGEWVVGAGFYGN